MLSKKEMEDLEMAKKGAEVLKEKLDKISELEKRITELEVVVRMHKENFESIRDALESNLGIMNDIQDRFRRHVKMYHLND